jgi:hypothetical protein
MVSLLPLPSSIEKLVNGYALLDNVDDYLSSTDERSRNRTRCPVDHATTPVHVTTFLPNRESCT